MGSKRVSSDHMGKLVRLPSHESEWPVLVCLLGGFRLLKEGRPIILRNPTKTRSLLVNLALEKSCCTSRDSLLGALWPEVEIKVASQSFYSLTHSLHMLLKDTIHGNAPIIYCNGSYRINTDAGIHVDIDWFKGLTRVGEQQERAGDLSAAVASYQTAVSLYHGDICDTTDTESLMISESLRTHYLNLLSRLVDYYFAIDDLQTCLRYAMRLLSLDPCREDAHRRVMCCYVRQGLRSQAFRQYHLCEQILRKEYDVSPEAATTELYNQIRFAPGSV